MLGTPKFIKETGEHVRIKKPLYPKDRDIFDFMLRAPNDDSPVVDNPILNLPEETSKTCKGDTGTMTRRVAPKGPGAEVEYIDKLLGVVNIEGFDVLYPTLASQNIFSLRCISPSHCPLCKREHENDNAYVVRNKKTYRYYCHRADQETPNGTKKPSLKLVISETAEKQEKRLPAPEKIERPRIQIRMTVLYGGTSKQSYTRSAVYEAI